MIAGWSIGIAMGVSPRRTVRSERSDEGLLKSASQAGSFHASTGDDYNRSRRADMA